MAFEATSPNSQELYVLSNGSDGALRGTAQNAHAVVEFVRTQKQCDTKCKWYILNPKTLSSSTPAFAMKSRKCAL